MKKEIDIVKRCIEEEFSSNPSYEGIGIIQHEEGEDELIIYLKDNNFSEEFIEKVKGITGSIKTRFRFIRKAKAYPSQLIS